MSSQNEPEQSNSLFHDLPIDADVEAYGQDHPPLAITPGYVGAVILGGIAGTLLRWLVGRLVAGFWATLTVNLVGSFLLGLVLEMLAKLGPDQGKYRLVRLCVGTGLLGAFTTYSAFAYDVMVLLINQTELGLIYLIGTLIGGLSLAYAGILCGSKLVRNR